jgi:hypothetical protein
MEPTVGVSATAAPTSADLPMPGSPSVEALDELLDLFFLRVSLPAQDSGGVDSSLRGDVLEAGAG